MEHRLRSPSRTYSDMPETRKVNPYKRPQPQYNQVQANAPESEQSKAYQQARKKGIFVPSVNVPGGLLRQLESPAPPDEPDAKNAIAGLPRSYSPKPGCSRDFGSPEESPIQKGNSLNHYEMARPSTSRGYPTNAVTAGTCEAADKKDDIEVIVVEDSDSDSQSLESFPSHQFFKEHRLPYSAAEDEEIVKFVLTGNNIEKTSSVLLWKELESKKGAPKRTYQSLKNRFMRNIKPTILTKFRHLLTPDVIKILKRRYQELRGTDIPMEGRKKYSRMRVPEKRVICVNPSMENPPRTYYTDRHFGVINLTERSEPEKIRPHKIEPETVEPEKSETPNLFFMPPNMQNREMKDASVGGDFPMGNEGPTQPQTVVEVDETNDMWTDPVPSTSQLERFVTISAKEKLLDVPIQTFKYYETLRSFSTKAAVNLKLVLDRTGAESLPADLPIGISVTVTIGKDDENETNLTTKTPASADNDNVHDKKEKTKKKRECKKCSKTPPSKGYMLKVRRRYTRQLNTPCYVQLASDNMLRRLVFEEGVQMENNALSFLPANQSQAGPAIEDNSQVPSQFTNCSTDDESCYTQTFKRVAHVYKVDVRPTETSTGDQSEGAVMNCVPAPIPSANPSAENAEIPAPDMLIFFRETPPPGVSVYHSCGI